jgi:hypothetical protein
LLRQNVERATIRFPDPFRAFPVVGSSALAGMAGFVPAEGRGASPPEKAGNFNRKDQSDEIHLLSGNE